MKYEPLKGIRVLDLGKLMPPAIVSHRLSAFGADVVKVEEPGGDVLRVAAMAYKGVGGGFITLAHGKRSIMLNPRDKADLAVLLRLIDKADVVIESSLPGAWKHFGVDFAQLREKRPALVVCSVTGFGQTGPMARLPAHGHSMDALAATLPLVWNGDIPRIGQVFTSLCDEFGGVNAALATVAAVYGAKTTGQGAWIDASCWDAGVEAHRSEIGLSARFQEEIGVGDQSNRYFRFFLASDGRAVMLSVMYKKFWEKFCRNLGREDLIPLHTQEGMDLPCGNDAPAAHQALVDLFAQATAKEWMERFVTWSVPGAAAMTISDVMNDPHFAAREMLNTETPDFPKVGVPIRWHHTDERAGDDLPPPPGIDQHRKEILKDWLGE